MKVVSMKLPHGFVPRSPGTTPPFTVGVIASSTEVASAFNRQTNLLRPGLLPSPVLVGELPPSGLAEVAKQIDSLATEAAKSGNAEFAGAASLVGVAARFPGLLGTLREDTGILDTGEAVITTLTPVLSKFAQLQGPLQVFGVGFATRAAVKALADGKFSMDDVFAPAALLTKATRLVGVRLPEPVEFVLAFMEVAGEVFVSAHDVGTEDAIKLARAIPSATPRPAGA